MRQILQRAAIFALVIAVAASSQDSRPTKKLLFLTHSAGYVHDVVKRPAPGQLSFAEKELTEILKDEVQVKCTQDCSVLEAENLRHYDMVAFYTTGELPAPAGGARALIAWVKKGGRFVGIHCATDTWYTIPAYGEMLGGVFDSHPWNQRVRLRNNTPFVNRMSALGREFEIEDEIYQFKSLALEPLQVWLELDPGSVDLSMGTRPDKNYALAWVRKYGDGRVFYTALGHRETAWRNEAFREHLRQGVAWLSTNGPVPRDGVDGARVLLPPPLTKTPPAFMHRDGTAPLWHFGNGVLQVVPGAGDVISKERFGDFSLHLEFRVPEHPPTDKGQARGNSGVYLQDRYEIQILDSFGLEPKADDCGAIYGKKAPLTNACRKPGEWQSYDVGFKAARFDTAGKKTANARASVWQNGLKIHDDVEIDGPTAGGQPETPEPGPLRLQDHGDLVAFRNIWVVPR